MQDIIIQDFINSLSLPPSSEPSALLAFTPEGAAEVLDNIMAISGIEFFTITTADDNSFFLIVDRNRTSNNVYLLNTVSDDDLFALTETREEGAASSSRQSLQSSANTEGDDSTTLEEVMQAIVEMQEIINNASQGIDSYGNVVSAGINLSPANATIQQQPTEQNGWLPIVVITVVIGGLVFFVIKIVLPTFKKGSKSDDMPPYEDYISINSDGYEDEEDENDNNEGDEYEVDDGNEAYAEDGNAYTHTQNNQNHSHNQGNEVMPNSGGNGSEDGNEYGGEEEGHFDGDDETE